jgi:signal transduction histidine kinase
MTPAGAAEGPGTGRKLRTQVAAAFVVTALIAFVSLAVMAWAFDRQVDARSRIINRIDPAALAARDVFASLVDQETGVRGFALSREEQFLAPFDAGKQEERVAARRLRALVRGEPALETQVAALDTVATRWREDSAARLIQRVRADRTPVRNTAVLDRSKEQFDAVRLQYAGLSAALDVERAAARDEIDSKTTQVIALSIAVVAVLIACAIVIWVGLRRLVLAPIDRLGRDARRVTAGDVEHPIDPSGPTELATLGADIEEMRERIVDDLAAAERARIQLARQARELTRSNAELEQFAYVASHDLQEPLRKVTSFCQLLEQRYGDQLDERGQQYLDFAVDGAKRMQQLILDLLAFSRVGRSTADFVTVDLGAAAADAVSNLEHTIATRGAVVEVGDLPMVSGDPTLLTALFQNLISNAIKFNVADVPTAWISAARTDAGWELACADNGIGIEPQHADRVFMIFQRLHARDDFEGTGIGLALCQKIVTYHGGSIWIDADRDDGTTIRWTLPTTPPGATES